MSLFFKQLVLVLFLIAVTPISVGAEATLLNPMRLLKSDNDTTTDYKVFLLVEAETNTPYFYQGRKEPSVGNPMKLVAIADEELAKQTNLEYKFIVSGRVINNQDNVAYYLPPDKPEILVTVQVFREQMLLAETSEFITLSKPLLLFYEENLLRGIGRIAISNDYIMIGDEVTLLVSPYFMSENINPNDFVTSWTINGVPTTMGREWQNIIITNPHSELRRYIIGFSLVNRTRLFEKAEKNFTLNFGL